MATENQIEICLEVQKLAMQISAQGKYEFHAMYWGHTDEIQCWGNNKGHASDIKGWRSRDHVVYMGTPDDGVELTGPVIELIKLRDDLSKFLKTDADGIPL